MHLASRLPRSYCAIVSAWLNCYVRLLFLIISTLNITEQYYKIFIKLLIGREVEGFFMDIQYKKLTEKELGTFIEMRICQLRYEGANENIDLKPAL